MDVKNISKTAAAALAAVLLAGCSAVPPTDSGALAEPVPSPAAIPRMGLMTQSMREVMMPLNAPPMITPTAMSITFPRAMNCLNSFRNCFICAVSSP